jgi:DNA invertase Pin-like site-specific DNA recombinase
MMNATKCYIYARVSTPAQNNNNHINSSLDTQQKICTEYAQLNNMHIQNYYSEICSARLVSNQEELQKVFNVIKRSYRDSRIYLLVQDVTRFSRDITGIGKIFESLENKNIVVHSIKDNVSYITNEKTNFLNTEFMTKLVDSQKEWNLISRRSKQSSENRKARGYKGREPYGKKIKICKKGNYKYVDNPMEKKVIQKILNLNYNGFSRKKIADYLNNKDITSRNGKPFSYQSVAYIVKKHDKMSMKSLKKALL